MIDIVVSENDDINRAARIETLHVKGAGSMRVSSLSVAEQGAVNVALDQAGHNIAVTSIFPVVHKSTTIKVTFAHTADSSKQNLHIDHKEAHITLTPPP